LASGAVLETPSSSPQSSILISAPLTNQFHLTLITLYPFFFF
jgi:hypothetical protein